MKANTVVIETYTGTIEEAEHLLDIVKNKRLDIDSNIERISDIQVKLTITVAAKHKKKTINLLVRSHNFIFPVINVQEPSE